MTKTQKITYGIVLGVVAILLVLGGFFDLALSDALYEPENFMARIFQSVGIFAPFAFISITSCLLFKLESKTDRKIVGLKKVLSVIVAVCANAAFGYMASETWTTILWVRAIVAVVCGAVFPVLTLYAIARLKQDVIKKLFIFSLFASIVVVISSGVLINVTKFIWGRPRYRAMEAMGDTAHTNFTAWYHPNGFVTGSENHSFPSGHTCSATNLLVLISLGEIFPEMKQKRFYIAGISGFYVFIMAYSRIVLGAHFLSDVAAGFLIGFITYAVAHYICFTQGKLLKIFKETDAEGSEETEKLPEKIELETEKTRKNAEE